MKFRCKRSGNVIEFEKQTDIESMLKETHYEVVEDKVEIIEEEPKKTKAKKAE